MTQRRINVLYCRLLILMVGTASFVVSPSSVGQSQSMTPKEIAREVQKLRSELNDLRAAQAESAKDLKDVKDVKTRLDETGWRALDFASQLSSAQWAMFGTGLAILGLLAAVAALGTYQGLHRLMESNLDKAAVRMEDRLTSAIRNEETRLQTEMNGRMEGIKELMESSRQGVQARTFSLISYAFWEQHQVGSGTTPAELEEKYRNLESAIHLSGLALECAMKVGMADPDAESLLTTIRGNRAYYITDLALLAKQDDRLIGRFTEEQRREAVSLADNVLPVALKRKDARWPEWTESCCWVLWVLGEVNQKKTVLSHLRQVYEHQDVNDETKAWIRKRYFENREPVWT